MEMQGQTDAVGIGGTETDGGSLAALLLALEDMGKKWPDDTSFQLDRATEALGAIIDTLAPLLEVALVRSPDGNCVKDIPAIEQLRALKSALSDLRQIGRMHPELEPTNYGGSSMLRHDQRKLQEAIVQVVDIIQYIKGYKDRKCAEHHVVAQLKLTYKGKPVTQKQLASMNREVKKRSEDLGECQ